MLKVKPTGTQSTTGCGHNSNEVITASDVFIGWLHHKQGPVYIAFAWYAPVKLPLAGHTVSHHLTTYSTLLFMFIFGMKTE